MIDLRQHYINVHPSILSRQWGRYKNAYEAVEASLPRYASVIAPLMFKTHPLGGFLIKNSDESSVLKDFFESNERKFLLFHKGKNYSRGLAYYPGLLKDVSDTGKIAQVITCLKDIVYAFDSETQGKKIDSVYAAMAQDYARNYLLILYHAFHLITNKQNLILKDQESLDQLNNQLKSTLLNTEVVLFRYICTSGIAASLPSAEILAITAKLDHFFTSNRIMIDDELRDKKLVREVREMDSLAHIFSFAQLLSKYHFHHNTILLGLEYGGIELPFAVNAVRILQQKQKLKEITIHVSNYSHRLFVPSSINDILGFKTEVNLIQSAEHVWILDDSVSTGRSFEKVINLFSKDIKIHIGVVAFKVSNRYHHLTMEDHGGFSPVVAKNSAILCQANYTSTYKRNSYLNRSGIFDVNKYNLYKMLGKELA